MPPRPPSDIGPSATPPRCCWNGSNPWWPRRRAWSWASTTRRRRGMGRRCKGPGCITTRPRTVRQSVRVRACVGGPRAAGGAPAGRGRGPAPVGPVVHPPEEPRCHPREAPARVRDQAGDGRGVGAVGPRVAQAVGEGGVGGGRRAYARPRYSSPCGTSG